MKRALLVVAAALILATILAAGPASAQAKHQRCKDVFNSKRQFERYAKKHPNCRWKDVIIR